MNITPDAAEDILNAGGSLRVGGFTAPAFERLAVVARSSGASLTIVANLTPDAMVKIAAAGGSAVTFDLVG